MKKFRPLLLLILTTGIVTISSSVAHSQVKCSLLDVSNGSGSARAFIPYPPGADSLAHLMPYC